MKNIILVPTDFTEVARSAVKHAVKMVSAFGGKVVLLHIIGDGSEREKAEKMLSEEADKIEKLSKDQIETVVRSGNIFDDIADVAEEIKASFIVMGTHGLHGIQFITGSHALKVVTSSKVPFIIVQNSPVREQGYDDIVVPLDLSNETKQKLKISAEIGHHFNSKIHLMIPTEKDEFLAKKLERNLNYAKSFFENENLTFDVYVSPEHDGGFKKDIINYAKEINAELIAIMNLQEGGILGLINKGEYEQMIITNDAQIPVMLINPKTTGKIGSVFSSI